MAKTMLAAATAILLVGQAALAAPVTTALKGADGAAIGTVTLTDAPAGVLLRVEAKGLAPGWHGIHVHEKADCSDAAFKSAGAHVHGAAPAVHGLLDPAATDMGDLPNIHAAADGTAAAELFTTMVALRPGTPRADLLDVDGSAIVIHAKADDYSTQPIGGAGDRVACAMVR